jgi:xylose isomerase
MTTVVCGNKLYYPGIDQIAYEGPASKNPLAYKWYDENRVVFGRSMKDFFRFAVCYWHSFCGTGADPFGHNTQLFPWNQEKDAISRATAKMDAAFEFISKLGVPFYCFHDFDLVEEGSSILESDERVAKMVAYAKEKQAASGIQLLWGTANLFSNRRYMNGAATNPDFDVLAHAATQVKRALDATIALDGSAYVFWGGREGYMSLLNTDMQMEKDNFARFLTMVRDYGRAQGFKGVFLIEPKPMEPSKHQYDFDTETVMGFLRQYGLAGDFKLNIETNHATLAGHTLQHELQCAIDGGLLGSMDANRGDAQNAWDTDQFPIDLYETIEAMMVLGPWGGFTQGGVNFDAKIRRNSVDNEDIFIGHIAGIDTFARALLVAERIINESDYLAIRQARYASFSTNMGQRFKRGELTLNDLRNHAIATGEPQHRSGKQERLEQIINDFL